MDQDSQGLAQRAEQLYEQRLKAQLEAAHRDEFVVIDPDTGDFFLGHTLTEAAQAFRKARPGGRGFIMRVGHRAAVHLGARTA
jgi:hypothetical protein